MVNACKSSHHAAVVRVVLLLLAALATTPRNTVAVSVDVGSTDVGSFSKLELSVKLVLELQTGDDSRGAICQRTSVGL